MAHRDQHKFTYFQFPFSRCSRSAEIEPLYGGSDRRKKIFLNSFVFGDVIKTKDQTNASSERPQYHGTCGTPLLACYPCARHSEAHQDRSATKPDSSIPMANGSNNVENMPTVIGTGKNLGLFMNDHHLNLGNDFQRPMFVVVVMRKANAKRWQVNRFLERFFHYLVMSLGRFH